MCWLWSILHCFIFLRVIIEFTIKNRVFPLVRFAAVMPGRNKRIYQRIGSRQLSRVIIHFMLPILFTLYKKCSFLNIAFIA